MLSLLTLPASLELKNGRKMRTPKNLGGKGAMKRIAHKLIIQPPLWVVMLVFAFLAVAGSIALCDEELAKREIRMGREAAAEVEKEHKLITDPQIIERVNSIGQAIAKIANSVRVDASYGSSEICQFEYKFKVIEDDDINAFSLPGGFVYVNSGLLNYVQSDHELAAVLAHEIAHASHHHMTYLLKEQSRLDGRIALVLLAGMLTKMNATDLGNVLIGAQLVKIARMSGYGQKAEQDADRTAVDYLVKSNYNPVGMVTFLERLARDYTNLPQPELGILRTHPPSRVRVKNTIARIEALGLPIKRRDVTKAVKAETEITSINGQQIARIKLGERVLFEPAPTAEGLSSEERAQAIAERVNQLLDSEPQLREIKVDFDKKAVVARGNTLIVVTEEDVALQKKSAEELATQAANTIKQVIWQELVQSFY